MFQLIDQIFAQLDEENNGYITSEKLLAIIKSIQDVPSSPTQDEKISSTNPPWGIFSHSPTSPPCVSYYTDFSPGAAQTESFKQCLNIPLFYHLESQEKG